MAIIAAFGPVSLPYCLYDCRGQSNDQGSVALTPVPAQATPLFNAIASRQCTRGDYDGKPLSSAELTLLERAGTSKDVHMMVITERAAMEGVLEQVVQANTAQMADPAFVKELKTWVRFNGADAVRSDGPNHGGSNCSRRVCCRAVCFGLLRAAPLGKGDAGVAEPA